MLNSIEIMFFSAQFTNSDDFRRTFGRGKRSTVPRCWAFAGGSTVVAFGEGSATLSMVVPSTHIMEWWLDLQHHEL